MASISKKKFQISNKESAALDKYLDEIGRFDLLPLEKEIELAKKIKNGDKKALYQLVEANLRFVVSIAKQYQGQGVPLQDLISEGNYGLIKAAYKYDETRGYKFISYAVWWIKQTILQALAEQSRLIRLPLNRVSDYMNISRKTAEMEQELEREPTSEELASALHVNSIDIVVSRGMTNNEILSLDKSFQPGEEGKLQDIIGTDYDRPDSEMRNSSDEHEIKDFLEKNLNKREYVVLIYFYGIGLETAMTLEEIGNSMGITRERARQLKENALDKLRIVIKKKNYSQITSLNDLDSIIID
jgi:RNA polymerase primary sigma factor